MGIKIETGNLTGEAPLYAVFAGQYYPQDAYIELESNGNVRADYSGDVGDSTPMDVWHGRTVRWSVSPYVSGEALKKLLADENFAALLERVHKGHSIEWDGNNWIGRLDDSAGKASLDIQYLLYDVEQASIEI